MKKFIPVLIIVLLLAVGGFFVFSNKTRTTQPGVVSQRQEQGGGNIITSIRDAMMKSMSLKCEYPDEKGNTVISYVKGENIRVVGYITGEQAEPGQLLMKDKKMYMWDDKTKKGTVIDLNFEVTPRAQEDVPETSDQQEETIEELEKYKDYCKTEAVADSMFAVPSDVQFVDFAEQFKDAGVNMEGLLDQFQNISPPAGE